ncbi:MAG: hypothetical protein AB1894_08315 [Chloroflexota bacterium]
MALTHRAFLFDSQAFREKAAPLVAALDSGTARPLFEVALQALSQADQDRWILSEYGSSLFDIHKLNFVGLPLKEPVEERLENPSRIDSEDIGYWFLLVFSTFLRRHIGIGVDFSILGWALSKLGWKPKTVRLLFDGTPTSVLLKSTSQRQPRLLSGLEPYWFWIRPSHSQGGGGWLSKAQISELRDRLQLAGEPLRNFDPERFGDRWGLMPITVPDGQYDYLKRLHAAYERANQMLAVAQQENSDLYMLRTYT